MKYIFELNSRTSKNESAEAKYEMLIESLKEVDFPWGITSANAPFPGFGKESVATIVLDSYMAKGIKCTVFLRYRNLLEGNSLSDDRIYIEFNPKKQDYQQLANEIFPKYVKIFNAYRGVIYDKELMFVDFDRSRNKNLRNTIIRFYHICYYDRELCIRALKMTPEKIVGNLKNLESVQIYNDGLFINNNSHFFTTAEADLFNQVIFSHIFSPDSASI